MNKLPFEAFAELVDIAQDIYWDNRRPHNHAIDSYYRRISDEQVARVLKMAGWTWDEWMTELEHRILDKKSNS